MWMAGKSGKAGVVVIDGMVGVVRVAVGVQNGDGNGGKWRVWIVYQDKESRGQ